MKKYFLIECILVLLICLDCITVAFIFEIMVLKGDVSFIWAAGVVLVFNIIFFSFLKKSGFEKKKISPYTYFINRETDDLISELEHFFGNKTTFEDGASYIISYYKSMNYKLLIYKCDALSKNRFFSLKKELAQKTKKIVGDFTTINKMHKKVWVNFIFVKEMNEYAYELVGDNANASFSRVEGILNVVFDSERKILFVPAHYGLSQPFKYNKVLTQIEKIVTN